MKNTRETRTSDSVCVACGVNFLSEEQKKESSVTTFHKGECGLCEKNTLVTHMRHYNYLFKKTIITEL